MPEVSLPHDAKAGPTKSAVRAVLLDELDLGPDDHFAEVGPCTGAVTIQAARAAGRVTAVERDPERLEVARKNLAANETSADVVLREAEAPEGLPEDADALFLGGSRNYEAVLDHAVETGVERVIMNVSRLEVAGAATEAFRERDLLDDVLQLQVSHGYELAGATSFDANNPVYVLIGGTGVGASDGGERVAADGGVRGGDVSSADGGPTGAEVPGADGGDVGGADGGESR